MPLILGGSSAVAAAFLVDNSCRFNTPDSPNLTRACGTPTDNLKYTISFWFKRSLLSDDMYIMSAKKNIFSPCLYSFIYIFQGRGHTIPARRAGSRRSRTGDTNAARGSFLVSSLHLVVKELRSRPGRPDDRDAAAGQQKNPAASRTRGSLV